MEVKYAEQYERKSASPPSSFVGGGGSGSGTSSAQSNVRFSELIAGQTDARGVGPGGAQFWDPNGQPLPDELAGVLEECNEIYQQLYPHRITA